MTMRSRLPIGTFLVSAMLLLATLDGRGAGRRRVVAVAPPSSPLEVTFVGSGPAIDAGTIAWRGGSRRSSILSRTVTMRIGEASGQARGTATVRAFVETFDPSWTVRVDGVALTTAPRVVRRHAAIGLAESYRIEIEIPTTAAGGPLHTNIGWEVTTE